MLTADYGFDFAVAFVVGLNLYLGPRIESERVAMQWGSKGEPTWCAPKWLAMWDMIAFMAAVRLVIWLASTYVRRSTVHGVELGTVIFSLIAARSHLLVLKARATF